MKYRASTSHGFTFESLDSRMYSRMLIAATISSDAIISSFLGKLESRKASAKRRRSPIDVSRRSSRATRSLKIFSGWSEESKVKLNVGDRRWSSRWFKEKTRERAMHASAIAGVGGGQGGKGEEKPRVSVPSRDDRARGRAVVAPRFEMPIGNWHLSSASDAAAFLHEIMKTLSSAINPSPISQSAINSGTEARAETTSALRALCCRLFA